mgnify:CR=1 FL=1
MFPSSSSEEINETFMMSKSAFKRALGTLYKNGIVLLGKTLSINGYNNTTIMEHTNDAGEGDLVKVIGVSDAIINYDPPVTALLTITSSAFIDYKPLTLPMRYLSSRLSNCAEGVTLGILIKTAEDELKVRINNISTELVNKIKKNYRGNFPITIDGKVKYARLAGQIIQEDLGMDKDKIQSRAIYLPLSYMVNYK